MRSASSTPASTPRSAASSTPAPPDAARRDRRALVAPVVALALLTLLAWGYIVRLAGEMDAMTAMAMPHAEPWRARDLGYALAMWGVMMAAMMTPTAAPMVLTFRRLSRSARNTALFLAAYLLVWLGFSVLAVLLQSLLHGAGMLAPATLRVAPIVGGMLLLVAGVWQLTPLRDACLSQCRSPVSFLMTEWREGARGAFRMGTKHGLWCVGCCWALMLLLFVAGVMNLAWIAAISAWVVLEKTVPDARWLSRVGAGALIGWGVWLLAGAARPG